MSLERLDKLLSSPALTTRDRDFVISLRTFQIRKGSLTIAQDYHLERLEKKNDPEAINVAQAWRDAYGPDHQQTATRVAHYYLNNPPYFGDLAARIIDNPQSTILSSKQWNKMCENKYAKKILGQYELSPKYENGQFLRIRKNNRLDIANYNTAYTFLDKAEKVAVVLRVDAQPITRAAKGARIYQILLVGETKPIYAHESDLKKTRRRKDAKN